MINEKVKADSCLLLGTRDLEDLADGAAFLGSGGGGDPYIGRLMAMHAIEQFGIPAIIEPEDLDDDAMILPVAMLGAPTVLVEKAASGEDIDLAITRLSEFLGKKPDGICSAEIGGLNSVIPIIAAARNNLPLVNCDGMGRAFPELQMTTFSAFGVSATPAVVVNEHLETAIVETQDPKRAEGIIRSIAIQMGLTVMMSCYPMTGKQVKNFSVKGTLRIALELGRSIREGRAKGDPISALMNFLRSTEYYKHCKVLFDGKVTDLHRQTTKGFAIGRCDLDDIDGSGDQMQVIFQNENLVARRNGKTVAIVPDLICMVDRETGQPITVEHLRYGQRIKIIGVSAAPILRTPEALKVVGPREFGIDEEFCCLEDLHDGI